MKVKIYYMKSQKKLCQDISSLLRSLVYKDVKIIEVEIEDNYNTASNDQMHSKCKEYLGLLKASILKIGDFSINVRDDGFKHQFYFGHWYTSSNNFLDLEPSHFKDLFPAIAVLDRFAILPEKVTEVLESHPRNFLWCPKPLELGGVEFVDVQDSNSWHNAISKLNTILRSELQKLCCRYIMVKKLQNLDFDVLSSWLDIDKNYLLQNEHDIQLKAAIFEVKVLSGDVFLSQKTIATIEIQNHSNYSLKQINIKVIGPYQTLPMPVSEFVNIKEGDAAKIQFMVIPMAVPFCPLEVRIDVGNDSIQPIIPTILSVKKPGI